LSCSLPIETSLEGLQLGTLSLCRRIDIRSFDKKSIDLLCFTLHIERAWSFNWWVCAHQSPRGDETDYQQASI